MLRDLLIFSLLIVASKATGEFTIISTPKSLSFKGSEPLQSRDIGDVLYASLGNAISGNSQWSGMTIEDPFNLPKGVIVLSLDGKIRSKVSSSGKTYSVLGDAVGQSLNGVSAQLEADDDFVCDINFEQYEEAVTNLKNVFGNVKVPVIANTKYLNSELHTADSQYLQSLAYLNFIADNLVKMQKSCNFISIRLTVDGIAKAHGVDSEAVQEALDLFSTSAKRLNIGAQKSRNSEALIVAIVNKADNNNRSKREVLSADTKNPYNLAEYYNEDYPVIFNIILWFMVVFGFSLLAICYAIGSMDPGRDSIIYRMTSTRMKKDN